MEKAPCPNMGNTETDPENACNSQKMTQTFQSVHCISGVVYAGISRMPIRILRMPTKELALIHNTIQNFIETRKSSLQ